LAEPKIPGGYILLSRKIIESKIWDKPPLYIKVWVYLLSKAQHKQYKQLEKGQLITSIPEIIKDCSWLVGYRREYPTKDQIYQIIEWLRNPDETHNESNTRATMIATTKATHKLLVTVCNYSYYQDSENYESNDEGNNEKATNPQRKQRLPNNINKNDKNNKNDNKDIYIPFQEIIEYLNLKTGSRYKYNTPKTQDCIKARCNEGFDLADFKKVIDNKVADWNHEPEKGQADMRPFLRPETLFGNKFEGYLNQKGGSKGGTDTGQSQPDHKYDKSKWLATDD
jgi:uncharacterized phage protein (TIGR02220 family)